VGFFDKSYVKESWHLKTSGLELVEEMCLEKIGWVTARGEERACSENRGDQALHGRKRTPPSYKENSGEMARLRGHGEEQLLS